MQRWIFIALGSLLIVACSSADRTTVPIPRDTSPASTPAGAIPQSFRSALDTLERFMQARIARQESVVLNLLSNRFRDQVMSQPMDVSFTQVSNPCWYRYIIVKLEQTAQTDVEGRVRVYEHFWGGDNAGGLPQSWEQVVRLVEMGAGWRVDYLGPSENRREEPTEPHGPTISACNALR